MIPVEESERWEWIESYLDGNLPEEDYEKTKNELKTNEKFRREVAEVEHAWKLLRDAHTEQIVRDTLGKLRSKPTVHPKRLGSVYKLGGSLLAACAAFLLFLMFSPLNSPSLEKDINILRGGSDPVELPVDQQQVYEDLLKADDKMTNKKFSEAAVLFQRVSVSSDVRPYFTQAAEWGLCVALLKSGKYKQAEAVLREFNLNKTKAYQADWLEKWKMWVQIHTSRLNR